MILVATPWDTAFDVRTKSQGSVVQGLSAAVPRRGANGVRVWRPYVSAMTVTLSWFANLVLHLMDSPT